MRREQNCVLLSHPDPRRLGRAKVILEQESVMHGMTLGWTLYSLVNEAVDLDEYPSAVRDGLRALRKTVDRQCLEAARNFRNRARSYSGGRVAGIERWDYENSSFSVEIPTEECRRQIEAIVKYESSMRGITGSQSLCQLIEEASCTCNYPRDIQKELHILDYGIKCHAIEASMSSM